MDKRLMRVRMMPTKHVQRLALSTWKVAMFEAFPHESSATFKRNIDACKTWLTEKLTNTMTVLLSSNKLALLVVVDATRTGLELVRSISNKHLDLLRSSARYVSLLKGQITDAMGREKGKYTLVKDLEHSQLGTYDKPLPCFGCGIGWFSFLLGFVFPLLWYYATILYFGNYYRRDPRERAGLAASAIAALAFTVVLFIVAAILFF